MSAPSPRWRPERLSPEARRRAAAAARAAGLPRRQWLGRIVRAASEAEGVAPAPPLSSAARKAIAVLAAMLQQGGVAPLDEARAYFSLAGEFDLSAEAIAAGVGRPLAHVRRALRLLALPENLRQLIERRALTAEHAHALLDAHEPDALARAVVAVGQATEIARESGARRGQRQQATGSG
jgi:hypothetical protein